MVKEIWKDIPGYEGRYQASNQGRIKSLERKVRSINWYTDKPFYELFLNESLSLDVFVNQDIFQLYYARVRQEVLFTS